MAWKFRKILHTALKNERQREKKANENKSHFITPWRECEGEEDMNFK